MTRLDEIKARHAAATRGPWYVDSAISGDGSVVMSEAIGFRVAHLPETQNVTNHEADADFVSNSHADVEWMMARIEKLEAIVDAARETRGFTLCACTRDKKCQNTLMYRLIRELDAE